MVYAYDLAILLPVKDLYDSQIMLASISAAKDMYQQGVQRIENFNKEYGDFITPIAKDQEWYDNNVTGKILNEINYMYNNGIDPVRSSEGRARILRLINSIPYNKINQLKTSAKNAYQYIDSAGKLKQAGMLNEDMEKYINNGYTLDNWSTIDNGSWNYTAATPYKDLATFTEPQYNQLKPSTSTYIGKDGIKYQKTAITEEDLARVAEENFADFVTSPQGAYLYNKLLAQTGNKDTAKQLFNEMIAGANTRRLISKDNIDPDYFNLEELKLKRADHALNAMKAAASVEAQKARANYYNAKASGGGGINSNGKTLFDVAKEAKSGVVVYDPKDAVDIHGITPIAKNVKLEKTKISNTNKKSKNDPNSVTTTYDEYTYNISKAENLTLYRIDKKGRYIKIPYSKDWINFNQNGKLKYPNAKNTKNRYFIEGTVSGRDANGNPVKIDYPVYMEVTETRGVNRKQDKYETSSTDKPIDETE